MRKYIIKLILIGIWCCGSLFILSSCQHKPNGVRPFNYNPAKWVTETGDIWFIVTEKKGSPDSEDSWPILDGGMTVEGKTYECKVKFEGHYAITFWEKEHWEYHQESIRTEDEILPGLLSGNCKFGSEKLVVKVFKDEESSKYFRGEKITFIRQPLQNEALETESKSQ